jgi:hypothetical protein
MKCETCKRESKIQRQRKYYAKHKDRLRPICNQMFKAWAAKNREHLRDYKRKYAPAKKQEWRKQYHKHHRARCALGIPAKHDPSLAIIIEVKELQLKLKEQLHENNAPNP